MYIFIFFIFNSVSAGMGHTLIIVKPDNELVQELPKWPSVPEVSKKKITGAYI